MPIGSSLMPWASQRGCTVSIRGERLKTWLDAALSNLLWVTCLSRGVGQDDLQRCLPTSRSLWCYKRWALRSFGILCFLSSFLSPLSENEMVCGSVPLSLWWTAVVGLQPAVALRAAAALLPCHGCQGHQKALSPRARATNWKLKKNLKASQNRNKSLKQTNKQIPYQNKNPTKIPLLPTAPCRLVRPFRLRSLCSDFTHFPHSPVLLSEQWPYPQHVACPSLWWDMIGLTDPFLLWIGWGCLQINSYSWKWAKLELYSYLFLCAFAHRLHWNYFINHFSLSHPQLRHVHVGGGGGVACCRRSTQTGERGKKDLPSAAALAARIRLSYLKVYLI